MSCEHLHEHLSALLDGELLPADAAELAAHMADCPDCTQTLKELAALRAALAGLYELEVSPALETRIRALTDDEPKDKKILPFKPRWRQAGLVTATAALAASLTLALQPGDDHVTDFAAVRDAALRSSVMQVTASGVAEIPGFTLVGTRADILAGHHAEVTTYMKGGTNFTLCSWDAGREPPHGVKTKIYHGMTIDYWNDGHKEYWAASPAPAQALPDFVVALHPGMKA